MENGIDAAIKLYEDLVFLPSKGESAAVGFKAKTAALCYDRIWSPFDILVPESIRCFAGTREEVTQGVIILLGIAWQNPEDPRIREIFGKLHNIPADLKRSSVRSVAKSFSTKHGIPMVPIYGFTESRDREYQEGDREAVVTAVSSLEIVDEEDLTWEKVLEFRADEENQRKYKRFLHWLDKEMVGKSKSFLEDEISIRLEDYEKALKKHGIKTVVGEVSEVLAGGGLIAALSEPKYGFLTAGALTIGKLVIKIAKVILDYDDVEKGPNSEISWVYEVRKLTE